MPNYLVGVVMGFLEPVLHAWSNVFDNYFSNDMFPNLSVLLFFGTILNILFLPIVLFFEPVEAFTSLLLVPIACIGIINIVYLFPYYWALRHADTSIVAALFSLGKIFVPILAYFVLGETLAGIQYAGFGLIVVSVVLLTLDFRKLRFNRAFFLMIGVSLALAIQAILYKYVFEAGATWGSVIAVLTAVEMLCAGAIMFAANSLASIAADFKKIRENLGLFVVQQVLDWGGNMGSSFAVSALPVTVAQAIAGTQPIFVLAYATVFKRRFGRFFNETTGRAEFVKKSVLFACIILGTVLVVAYGAPIDF